MIVNRIIDPDLVTEWINEVAASNMRNDAKTELIELLDTINETTDSDNTLAISKK